MMTAPEAPARLVLLCIDMQPPFIRAVTDGAEVQRRCEFAVAAAVGLGVPVVFSEQVPEKLGSTAAELRSLAPTAAAAGKDTFSVLECAALRHLLLEQHAAEHLLLCGIETSICVYQTAVSALAEKISVTILSDAVGARRPADASTCLAALRDAGAHVLPSETVFYSLLHNVKHPFFKAYTQLVKSHA